MSKQGVEHLTDALQEKIDYFRREYDLTYAETIGVLAILQMSLFAETVEEDDTEETP